MNGETIVDDLARAFAAFLSAAWPNVTKLVQQSENRISYSDWLQANWEVLVEGALPPGIFLEVYGEGADLNDRSSRVCAPSALATHAVVVKPRDPGPVRDLLSDAEIALNGEHGLPLEEFVTMKGSWYAPEPPFDCVLVESDDGTYVFRMSDVWFALGPACRG